MPEIQGNQESTRAAPRRRVQRSAVAAMMVGILLTSSIVAADDFYCEANVAWFYVAANGSVDVKLQNIEEALGAETLTVTAPYKPDLIGSGGTSNYANVSGATYVRICDLDSPWTVGAVSISPLACASLLDAVITAKLAGSRIRIKYTASDTRVSCSTVGAYGAALMPIYVKNVDARSR